MKGFSLAMAIRALFVLPGALITLGPAKFVSQFPQVLRKLFSRSSMNFALFISIMSGGTRAATCLLRYIRNVEDGVNHFLAGIVGSLGVLLFSNIDFSMYLVSKAMEGLFMVRRILIVLGYSY